MKSRLPRDILFFGSDEFSVTCCRRLLQSAREGIVGRLEIVTPPDQPRTKQPEGENAVALKTSQTQQSNAVALKRFARENGIANHVAPPKTLIGWTVIPPPSQFDLACVVSFGYFVPKSVIRAFPLAALNVHPSLLPKYRGAAPIQHTILNGDSVTGVTIQELDEKQFDAGRILHQSSMEAGPYPFYKELHDRLARQGAEDLVKTVANLEEYKVNATVQDSSAITHARKISKDSAAIHWESMTRERIYALHRALGYKASGSLPAGTALTIPLYSEFRGKRTQLLAMSLEIVPAIVPADAATRPAGSVFYDKATETIFVKCADGLIGVTEVKVQGKKELGAKWFENGYQLKFDDRFESALISTE
ncbi:formyl transferase [Chytriomyces sp. MP71]|nr:formyl transferase [Chytriomyces sp. MP71]